MKDCGLSHDGYNLEEFMNLAKDDMSNVVYLFNKDLTQVVSSKNKEEFLELISRRGYLSCFRIKEEEVSIEKEVLNKLVKLVEEEAYDSNGKEMLCYICGERTKKNVTSDIRHTEMCPLGKAVKLLLN